MKPLMSSSSDAFAGPRAGRDARALLRLDGGDADGWKQAPDATGSTTTRPNPATLPRNQLSHSGHEQIKEACLINGQKDIDT